VSGQPEAIEFDVVEQVAVRTVDHAWQVGQRLAGIQVGQQTGERQPLLLAGNQFAADDAVAGERNSRRNRPRAG
jgi:hypothetical protein